MLGRQSGYRRGGRSAWKMRLVMALILAGFSLCSYYGSSEYNEVTGEKQYISLTPHQEIALGLQAAPQMMKQHGGLHPSQEHQDIVDKIGWKLVNQSDAAKTEWKFDFHLLRDSQTINAFALPGGQCFITAALYGRLKTEGQVAGVMGHEIAHVIARHGAQRMAKQRLTQGLTGAVLVAADPSGQSGQMAQMVAGMINMKYGREDELESDRLGVKFMVDAGYDPRSMIEVMKVLAEASGGRSQPEFFSTHPNPDNRIEKIEAAIRAEFPNGVPSNLIK